MIKGILYEKFLGVKFHHKLAFDRKVKSISLGRSIYCISEKEFTNEFFFFSAQINYFPLIWMILQDVLKMSSSEFLLLNKNKNHDKSKEL